MKIYLEVNLVLVDFNGSVYLPDEVIGRIEPNCASQEPECEHHY